MSLMEKFYSVALLGLAIVCFAMASSAGAEELRCEGARAACITEANEALGACEPDEGCKGDYDEAVETCWSEHVDCVVESGEVAAVEAGLLGSLAACSPDGAESPPGTTCPDQCDLVLDECFGECQIVCNVMGEAACIVCQANCSRSHRRCLDTCDDPTEPVLEIPAAEVVLEESGSPPGTTCPDVCESDYDECLNDCVITGACDDPDSPLCFTCQRNCVRWKRNCLMGCDDPIEPLAGFPPGTTCPAQCQEELDGCLENCDIDCIDPDSVQCWNCIRNCYIGQRNCLMTCDDPTEP